MIVTGISDGRDSRIHLYLIVFLPKVVFIGGLSVSFYQAVSRHHTEK